MKALLTRSALARVALLVSCLASLACSKVPVMRGEIAGLEKLIAQADANGAKRCAPRELALAKSHTTFAATELDQADVFRAEDHLIIARSNAQAAYDLSPPNLCSERRFVMEPAAPPPPPPPRPGDKDGDGYLDNEDGCIDQPENYQGYQDGDGCPDDPDTDGDGLPDSKDACELLPEDKDGYLDADGCPDVDNDLDGVPDAKDGKDGSCKNDPEDPDGYQDTDGCPEPDNDGDEVVDLDDQCPMVPGVKGGPKPGCPKKPSLVVVTEKEIKITQQIHFAFAKATIRPISYKVLDAVVEVLKDNPKIEIEVQGHTDDRGSDAYNKKLSDDRAHAVRKYLVTHGVASSRLKAHGYGEEKPLVPNSSARNRALNRRVQFVRIEK
jgi:outer membrane protein OmpA-like peptidoglycan-associated protein